jgi:kumamolisin
MTITVPPGYSPVSGTEQGQPAGARLTGPQDARELITVRVVLRRRTDTDTDAEAGLADRLRTHPLLREPLTADEFGTRFGASAGDIDRVAGHLRAGGLTIIETNGPSRTIRAAGPAEALNRLFSVELGRYEAPLPVSASPRRRGERAGTQTYRSHVGPVHVPDELADLIIGVFGLDNRMISLRDSAGDPPGTTTTTVPQIASRYNFPTNSAEGQTVAIFATYDGGSIGFAQSDIHAYYAGLPAGYTAPIPLTPNVDGTANDPGNPDPEATQDICIASTVAQGAAIAVYLNAGGTDGWLAVLDKVTFPVGSEPRPSVLSSSFYLANGDDASALAAAGITTSFLTTLSGKFADAGAQGVTSCIASGATGADS